MHTNEFDNIIYIEDNSTYYWRKLFKMFRYMLLVGFGYVLGTYPQIISKIVEWFQ